MQGKFVERDILTAFNFFNNLAVDELDVIMIARGGGSTADLSWFDNKKIAEAVAFSKFAVISAIGHEINTSITDMVSHTFVKTPTKGAQFLIEKIKEFIEQLKSVEQAVLEHSEFLFKAEKQKLSALAGKIDSALPRYFQLHKEELLSKKLNMASYIKALLTKRQQELAVNFDTLKTYLNKLFKDVKNQTDYCQAKVRLLDPKVILKRGYSITLKDDKALKSIDNISESDIIKTLLYGGRIISQVTEKSKNDD
jgi:exodeoxyribonuclease VII large subunit